MKPIDDVAAEIHDVLAPMPVGFYVRVADDRDNILVGNDELVFCVSRKTIEDGQYMTVARESFPTLLSAMALHHAEIARKLDPRMLCRVADAVRMGIDGLQAS